MLAEFFLTPELFSGTDDELRTRLKTLREYLLPKCHASTVVAARLGGDAWETAVLKVLLRIKNQYIRQDAHLLFEQIRDKISVERPLPPNSKNKS